MCRRITGPWRQGPDIDHDQHRGAAKCDPLGPENKLIFAPGLLSGTSLVNTSRISIGAKSPLTGTIKESNVGGTVAAALGRLGITAMVIEGQAPEGELSFLRIDEKGEASLLSGPRIQRDADLCSLWKRF